MPWPGRRLPDRQFIAPPAPAETEGASLYPRWISPCSDPTPYSPADVPEEGAGEEEAAKPAKSVAKVSRKLRDVYAPQFLHSALLSPSLSLSSSLFYGRCRIISTEIRLDRVVFRRNSEDEIRLVGRRNLLNVS